MHYCYDSGGRMLANAYAQSNQTQSGAPTSAPFYTAAYPASSRARTLYTYDAAGRILNTSTYWDNLTAPGATTYNTQAVLANSCGYEYSGLARGLKLSNAFYQVDGVNKSQFDLKWTENYGYDPHFDYLTSANYGDGMPNAVQSWTYDAAGNRTSDYTGTSWSYDNLNRMTVSPGATYTNDILGNRLTKGSASYGWDCLNRMVSYMNGSANETYGYRADGMRTFKSNSGSTTAYRYDGQMGMEDVDLAGSNTTVTDYGLGARGIDYISSSVNGGGANISFPVYDAHGNMVATLARNGGGTYQVSNQRAYGAWGEIRQGATTGDPKGRYCANLGHKQDDESGLTYMRARYYDGASGRFISQDTSQDGPNWFGYARSNPLTSSDRSGNESLVDWLSDNVVLLDSIGAASMLLGLTFVCSSAYMLYKAVTPASIVKAIQWAEAGVALVALGFSGNSLRRGAGFLEAAVALVVEGWLASAATAAAAGSKTMAGLAISASFAYSLVVAGALAANIYDDLTTP